MPNDLGSAGLIETPAERNEREQAEEKRREAKQRKLQLWFNGILTFATILTAIIVCYQNRILRLALEETQRGQRPWVGVYSTHTAQEFSLNQIPTVSVAIKNSGQIPALELTSNLKGFYSRSFPLAENFQLRSPSKTESVFPLLGGATANLPVGFEVFEEKHIYAYIVGTVKYKDVFKEAHTTRLCLYKKLIAPLKSEFTICPNLNSMD